jgi:hypothetical protein
LKNYSQLTQGLRYQIEILKKAGKNQKDIAELVNVSGPYDMPRIATQYWQAGLPAQTGATKSRKPKEADGQAAENDG